MKHTTSRRFWHCLEALPAEVQEHAKRAYALLRQDPSHPSLHFKQLGGGKMYSVRIGLHFRALGLPREERVHWFWIGSHSEYDKLVGG